MNASKGNNEPIIETDRLCLRELRVGDAERLSLVLSDPVAMRFYPAPFAREEVEKWIGWNIDNYARYGFGLWAVVLKETGMLIGDCGITMQEIEGELVPEIGYHIIGEYCGKGYASEAAKACIGFAFGEGGFDRAASYMKEDNGPSRRVAEKNGMQFVKCFDKVIKGSPVREALYEIRKND